MKWLLDRMGIASISNHEILRHKVGASVNAVRRAGGMETDNMLNNVMLFRKMIIVGSNYWNMVYEIDAGDVLNDDEGIANMKKIGQNTAWLLKKINYINDFFTPCKMPRGVHYIKSVVCKHIYTTCLIQT